jgi:hypothetical protein
MIISNFGVVHAGDARISSATVSWEDRDFPDQELVFEIRYSEPESGEASQSSSADAFLAACFPLAAVYGESRVRVDGRLCPMLVEGLYTAHAWWTSWGGMPTPVPNIEMSHPQSSGMSAVARRAVALLSGGVDSLHLLLRNHRLYRREDAAYVRDVIFIHGFDIGKRARDPEEARYRMVLQRLEPIIAELGLRLIQCRTNLRHLPSKPDFWELRHSGAALAAAGHSAISGSAFLFIGASWPTSYQVPWGSHPLTDPLFSSQRVAIIHDGSRFSRLQKVCDLASWPLGLAALRVCPAASGPRANCRTCEKCLRTRLELLAAGIGETEAFGPGITPGEIWNAIDLRSIGDRIIFYEDLVEPLKARGHHELSRVLERKIQAARASTDDQSVY